MIEPLDIFTLPLSETRLIEASAGTGKTWTMTGLYARMLLEGEGLSVSKILVVTFTTAATAELRERLRLRLTDLLAAFEDGDHPDVFCRDFIARFVGQESVCIHRLQLALAGFDEAAIYTIHSFCQRVLAEAAFEAGSDFDTQLMTDPAQLLAEVVTDLWREHLYQADPLWAQYLFAHGESPEVWARRYAPHMGKPYLQQPEWSSQWTVDSALPQLRQAQEAVAECVAHGFTMALDLLQTHPGLNRKRYRADLCLKWLETVKTCLDQGFPNSNQIEALQRLTPARLSAACREGTQPPEHPLFAAIADWLAALDVLEQSLHAFRQKLLAQIESRYAQRKQEAGVQSFDDLLVDLATALQDERAAALCTVVRSRYQAALIDEFQDTDPVQWQIFQQLFAVASLPLLLVGDPKQAIYSFRGGDLATYLAARRSVVARYALDRNFRSNPELMQGINLLFSAQRCPAAFLEQIQYEPVQGMGRWQLQQLDGNRAPLRFVFLAAPDSEKGFDKANATQTIVACLVVDVVDLLQRAQQDQVWLTGPDGRRELSAGDIAILVSSHRQAAQVEQALQRAGVPAVRQAQESVFASAEATLLRIILQAMLTPSDEQALCAALASPAMGDAEAVVAQASGDTQALEHGRIVFDRWHALWLRRGFMVMFRDWLESRGPDQRRVAARLLAGEQGERRLTNILHLAELLQAQSRLDPNPASLIQWYDACCVNDRVASEDRGSILQRLPSDAARVRIVTIHSSKGLEYPVVFCPFLWDGKLLGNQETVARCHDDAGDSWLDFGSPDFIERQRRQQAELLAERVRLLYVALTRARCYLQIYWGRIRPPTLNKEEQKSATLPSWQDKSDSLHTSALAWLLHGAGCQSPDELLARLLHMDEAAMWADLQQLAMQQPAAIQVIQVAPDAHAVSFQPTVAESRILSVAQWPHTIQPGWRLTSFSRMTRVAHDAERPDHDFITPLPDRFENAAYDRFSFPGPGVAANVAGVALHTILENWAKNPEQPLSEQVLSALRQYGIAIEWQPVLLELLQAVLACPLDGQNLRLQNLFVSARLAELEFTFPIGALDVAQLAPLLARYGAPAEQVAAAQALQGHELAGFLKGFIDLVFCYEGRYYVLDWKSNWLGNAFTDYGKENLERAMLQHHYDLQALIYAAALNRYLRVRVPDFQPQIHWGGCYYLFLRGIQAEDSTWGVWFNRQGEPLLTALDAWLAP